jgi:hypothetical protein
MRYARFFAIDVALAPMGAPLAGPAKPGQQNRASKTGHIGGGGRAMAPLASAAPDESINCKVHSSHASGNASSDT